MRGASMRQKPLLSIGGGLVAASLVVGAVAASRTFVVTIEPGHERDMLQRPRSGPGAPQPHLAKNVGG